MSSGGVPQAILNIVERAQEREAFELAQAAAVEQVRVISSNATGTGNLDQTFALNKDFRLVFVRCHFSGGTGRAALTVTVDSGQGAVHDTRLFTVKSAGQDADVNLRLTSAETAPPSAWAFQPGDAVRVQWTNPDPGNMTWGIEVGLAPA